MSETAATVLVIDRIEILSYIPSNPERSLNTGIRSIASDRIHRKNLSATWWVSGFIGISHHELCLSWPSVASCSFHTHCLE